MMFSHIFLCLSVLNENGVSVLLQTLSTAS